MGPNNISAKPMVMPAAKQKQVVSTTINAKLKINYGDEAKVNRLSNALDKVKSSQGRAFAHVESAKSTIIM